MTREGQRIVRLMLYLTPRVVSPPDMTSIDYLRVLKVQVSIVQMHGQYTYIHIYTYIYTYIYIRLSAGAQGAGEHCPYIVRIVHVCKYLSKRPAPETVSRTRSGTHCTRC
jgi:hypothetical protein